MDKNTIKSAIQQNRINRLASSTKGNAMPGLKQMAKNLSNDIIKNVKSVAAGNSLTTESSEGDRRKAICESCEFFNKSQDRCSKCGCYLAVKAYLKASSCPMNKW